MELLPRLTARCVATAVRLSGRRSGEQHAGQGGQRAVPRLPRRPRRPAAPTASRSSPARTARRRPPTWRPARSPTPAASIVHNSEGANLLSGIATAFSRRPAARFALLEIDEAIVPAAAASAWARRAPSCSPTSSATSSTATARSTAWPPAGSTALRRLASTVLIANADDPIVTWVAQESGCPTVFFGVEVRDGRADREVSDVTICPRCATMLAVLLALAVAARRLPLPVVRLRAAAARPRGARPAHRRRARGGAARPASPPASSASACPASTTSTTPSARSR